MDLQPALEPPFNSTFPLDDQPSPQPATSQASSVSGAPEKVVSQFDHLLPAAHRNKDTLEHPSADLTYLEQELNLERLNNVHGYLWLAGRPMPPRPLHYQRAASRETVVVEQMDLHLLWEPNKMYLKPIPRYLLNYDFWNENLVCKPDSNCACFVNGKEKGPAIVHASSNQKQLSQAQSLSISRKRNKSQAGEDPCTRRRRLYKSALGFLLSYAALIQYESDFRIARDAFLVPETVTWPLWRELVRQLLSTKNRNDCNIRFRFGELRLHRLNLIYRFKLGYIRGYKFGYQNYGGFFQDNLAPIASFITYIAIVLTAMQVGLATETLGSNETFQRASYGFTVFSILSPLILIGVVGFVAFILFFHNLFATLLFKRKRFDMYDGKVELRHTEEQPHGR